MVVNPDRLRASLLIHEGERLHLYKDTEGNWTGGVGHNFTADGLSKAASRFILDEDIHTAQALTLELLPWVNTLDEVRTRAFVEIVFNLGRKILGFHDALGAAQRGDWPGCVVGFQQSLWHAQVGHRAVDLEYMLQTGHDCPALTTPPPAAA